MSAAAERRGGARRPLLGLAPALAVVTLLFGAGMLGAVRSSLGVNARAGWGDADLAAYRALVSDPLFWDSVRFTLQIAVLATVISALLALGLAAALRRSGALPRTLAALPVPMPHLTAAALGVLWLGPGGLADRLLGGLPVDLVRDPWGLGVVLVYVYKETPFLALLVLASWSQEVAAREEAAAVLGARPLQRMRLVVWPAVRAPLMTGGAIVAAFVVGALEVPLVIGPTSPETLAELALSATRAPTLDGRSSANAILLVASLLAIGIAGAVAAGLRGRR